MSHYTTRPRSDGERDRCIAAVGPLVGSASTPPVVKAVLDGEFVAGRDAYLTARSGWRVSSADTGKAGTSAASADASFDLAFRLWVASVRDPQGISVPLQLSKLMGGVRPGRLVELPYREEVTKTSDLIDQVGKNPDLAGDSVKLSALADANRALDAAVTAEELATIAEKQARLALTSAEKAFDLAWGTVVKKLNQVGLGAIVPRFLRSDAQEPPAVEPAPVDPVDPPEAAAEPAPELPPTS